MDVDKFFQICADKNSSANLKYIMEPFDKKLFYETKEVKHFMGKYNPIILKNCSILHLACVFQPDNVKVVLDSIYCTEEFFNKTVEYSDANDSDHYNDWEHWEEQYTSLTCLDLACIYQPDAVKHILNSKFCTPHFMRQRDNLKGYTYLHYACKKQPVAATLILSSKLCPKNVFQYGTGLNKTGESILHIACKQGDLALVKAIIGHSYCSKEFFQAKYGYNPEIELCTRRYNNCLHVAIDWEQVDVFEELLKHKHCTKKFIMEECYLDSNAEPYDYRSCLELICSKNARGYIYQHSNVNKWLRIISKYCNIAYIKKIYKKVKKDEDDGEYSETINIDHTLDTLKKCMDSNNEYGKHFI